MRGFKFLTVLVVCAFVSIVSVSCGRGATKTSLTREDLSQRLQYREEFRPFNRLPMDLLEREGSWIAAHGWGTPPEAQTVQVFEGEEQGIRPLTPEQIDSLIRAGDIGVRFVPVDPDHAKEERFVASMMEEGMGHAFVVVPREDFEAMVPNPAHASDGLSQKFCHVDVPISESGCHWADNVHFFRVVGADDETSDVNARVASLSLAMHASPKSLAYDAALKTDLFAYGLPAVKRQIEDALQGGTDLPALYCSEFPFTTQTLVRESLLFGKGENLVELVRQMKSYQSDPVLGPLLTTEKIQEGLEKFIMSASQSIPSETQRRVLGKVLAVAIGDSLAGQAIQAYIEHFYPPAVFPHVFMHAAKGDAMLQPSARVVYLGTREAPIPAQ
jgi:hypothetical protein